MSTARKKILVPAAILMSLTLAPMLSGCMGNPIQGLVEQATGGQLDIGGTSVPDDFPAQIPLISGNVIFGTGLGNDDGKVWNVAIEVAGASAMDSIKAQLESAGFESIGEMDSSEETSSGIFTQDPYGILVVVAPNQDKNGFVANYTVTFTKEGS